MKRGIIFLLMILLSVQVMAMEEGELATSKPQNISVFVLPTVPILNIVSPKENRTYRVDVILLNYTYGNEMDEMWYNFNGSENVTIISSTIIDISGFSNGEHTIYVYAKNIYGIVVKEISFFVEFPVSIHSGGGSGGGGSSGSASEQEISEEFKEKISDEILGDNEEAEEELPIVEKVEKIVFSKKTIWIIVIFVVVLLILSKKPRKNERV